MNKRYVDSEFGTHKGTQDSWVGKGETITDGNTAHLVTRGSKVGVDDVPANTEDAAVLGNRLWISMSQQLRTPITYAEATRRSSANIENYDKKYNKKLSEDVTVALGTGSVARSTAKIKQDMRTANIGKDLELVERARQDQLNERPIHDYFENGMLKANCGKNMRKLKLGQDQLGNIITSGMGILGGIGLIIDANELRLNNPTIYAPNQYEQQALTTMAGLRDNPYNQLRAMQDIESRNRYAVNQSGGLTGGLKYLANVASGIGMQKNYADVLHRSNEKNNAYKSAWASAAMQAGLANAQRMQASNQYRDEAYARSHGARNQMRQMGMQNILGLMQQYYANEFKRRQFEKMMDLYWAELNAKYPNTTIARSTSPVNNYDTPDRGTINLKSNVPGIGGITDLDWLRRTLQVNK